MSGTDRDNASVTLKFNLPPSIIREYFDGLSKVERSKHYDSGIDLSVLTPLIPFFLSYLSSASGQQNCNAEEFYFRDINRKCDDEECEKDEEKYEEKVPENFDNVHWDETETDVCEEKTPEVKTENEGKKSGQAAKRPVYQEGENVTFDFKDLMGGNPNGVSDMMKMMQPMLQGLIGGMGGGNLSVSTPESYPESISLDEAVRKAVKIEMEDETKINSNDAKIQSDEQEVLSNID